MSASQVCINCTATVAESIDVGRVTPKMTPPTALRRYASQHFRHEETSSHQLSSSLIKISTLNDSNYGRNYTPPNILHPGAGGANPPADGYADFTRLNTTSCKHPKGERRTANPLIIQKIWPEYLSSLDTCHREYYERPEASWRRMLLHQPPTAKLCSLDYTRDYYGPITPFEAGYLCAVLSPRDEFPRLQDLQKELETVALKTFDGRMIFVEGSPQYSGCRPWGIIRPRPGFIDLGPSSPKMCDLVTFRGASREVGGVSERGEQQVETTAGSLFWIALPSVLDCIENRLGNRHRPERPLKNYHQYVGLDEVPIFPWVEGWRLYYDAIKRC